MLPPSGINASPLLSASANKLTNLKKHAVQYAALIMEELDPDHLGYIEVTLLTLKTITILKKIETEIPEHLHFCNSTDLAAGTSAKRHGEH